MCNLVAGVVEIMQGMPSKGVAWFAKRPGDFIVCRLTSGRIQPKANLGEFDRSESFTTERNHLPEGTCWNE